MPNITAILLNYKRPENVREIIPVLKAQSVKPWVVLVNNGHRYIAERPDQMPDETWQLPHNIGPFARFLAAYAYSDWLYFQDDDLVPTDDTFIEDMHSYAQQIPGAIFGVYGRHIRRKPPHYDHPDTVGSTNMVKTVCMMMHRATLGRVRFPAGDVGRNDDIHVALETSRGEAISFSDPRFDKRLKQLSQMGVGLCQQPEHYSEREQYCAEWIRCNA